MSVWLQLADPVTVTTISVVRTAAEKAEDHDIQIAIIGSITACFLAVMAAIPGVIAAVHAKAARQQATETNKAVNSNKPDPVTGETPLRLYDRVGVLAGHVENLLENQADLEAFKREVFAGFDTNDKQHQEIIRKVFQAMGLAMEDVNAAGDLISSIGSHSREGYGLPEVPDLVGGSGSGGTA